MPATQNITTPSPLPVFTGKNMAPLKPLEQLAKKVTPDANPICNFFQKFYDSRIRQDEQSRRDIIDIGKMIANLKTGKLLLLRHPFENRYAFVKRDTRLTDHKKVSGSFQFYCTKLDAAWIGSKPDLDPVCPSDDDRIEDTIAAVKIVQDHYSKKLFDTRYELNESHSSQEYGTYITRFRWDPEKDDIVAELLPFPACIFDVRFRPEESPHFIYEQKCPTNLLSKMVDADVKSDGESADNYGLQIIEEIARQGGGVSGHGQFRTSGNWDTVSNESIVTEMWLKPETYCDIEIPAGEKTLGGVTLPKGKTLDVVFPNGLVAVGIDGMKTIIGLYDEAVGDHIVSGVYHLQSFSGVGKGVNDAVDAQKEMDDLHSQAMAYVKTRGTPAFIYDKNAITEDEARNIGKPRANIPIDLQQGPDGVRNVGELIQPLQPLSPAQGVFEYGQQLENYLQIAFQVTNFSDGMPGVDNKTATGVKYGEANAKQLLVPQLLNKADHRARASKVILNLFKKYADTPKFFAVNNKNGISKGKWFDSEFFEEIDIEFEIVADSEVPQTPYTKEESLSRLFQWTGGLQGLEQSAQTSPELTGKVVQIFGADLPIAKSDDIARVCRKRIEQAKEMVAFNERVAQGMESMTGAPSDTSAMPKEIVDQLIPPISTKEPYHQQKVMWLADLLDDDEMLEASQILRDVLGEMISRHISMETMFGIEVQQAQSLEEIGGMVPQILAQKAMEGQEAGQQEELAEGQRQQQQLESDQQAGMDHQRKQELSDQTHRQQLEMEGVKAQQAQQQQPVGAGAGSE